MLHIVMVIDSDGVHLKKWFRNNTKAKQYEEKLERKLCLENYIEYPAINGHFVVETHSI